MDAISEEEYLHTSYRPDCDVFDGLVLERNWGDFDHSTLQSFAKDRTITQFTEDLAK